MFFFILGLHVKIAQQIGADETATKVFNAYPEIVNILRENRSFLNYLDNKVSSFLLPVVKPVRPLSGSSIRETSTISRNAEVDDDIETLRDWKNVNTDFPTYSDTVFSDSPLTVTVLTGPKCTF